MSVDFIVKGAALRQGMLSGHKVSVAAARLSIAAAGACLLLLASLHVLSPEFDPSFRVVSEYANGQYGWVLSHVCRLGSKLVGTSRDDLAASANAYWQNRCRVPCYSGGWRGDGLRV